MKVNELIELLKSVDGEMEVLVQVKHRHSNIEYVEIKEDSYCKYVKIGLED